MMRCPECHGVLIENEQGEIVCANCGLVVNDLIIEEPRFLYSKRVLPYKHHVDSRSKGSLILLTSTLYSYNAKRVELFRRLSKVQSLSPLFRKRSTHYRAIKTLEKITRELCIPEVVKERAIQVYFKLLRKIPHDVERPNHYRIMAASLIFAIKEAKLSIPIKSIITRFMKLGHRVDYKGVIRVLFCIKNEIVYNNHIDLKSYVYRTIEKLLSKYHDRNSINLDELKMEIYRKSIYLISSLEKLYTLGRNPYIIALAAIYAATIIVSGKKKPRIITQKELSRVSGFSESAIRTCYKELFKKFIEK